MSGILKMLGEKLGARVRPEPEPDERVELLRRSGLIDEQRYLADHPDVVAAGSDPIEHYLLFGSAEGRHLPPLPLFDPEWYVEQYPRLEGSAELDLLLHYVREGDAAGATPHPLFDAAYFGAAHPYLPRAGGARLAHFLALGTRRAGSPHPLFDANFYFARHPELGADGPDPLLHYLEHGAAAAGPPHPLFDPVWYVERYDVGGLDPLVHYVSSGEAGGYWPHPLFDPFFYRATNPDLTAWSGLLLHHYAACGAREGRAPCRLFDAGWYTEQYADVIASGLDPITHYLTVGDAGGLWPHPLFDPDHYGAQHSELAKAGGARLLHYVHGGGRDGTDPHPLFCSGHYLEQALERVPDFAASSQPPLEHYLERGEAAGLWPNPLFDPADYLARNSDLAAYPGALLAHYFVSGSAEGRRATPLFDGRFYLDRHPELEESGGEPLAHYLHEGARQGADPHPLFAADWYRRRYAIGDEEPLAHFLATGAAADFDPHPLFDSGWVRQTRGLPKDEVPIFAYLESSPDSYFRPSPFFDPAYYLTHNHVHLGPHETPLAHFVTKGVLENRRPGPLFDFCVQFYRQAEPELRETGINAMAGYLAEPYAGLSCADAELSVELPAQASPEVSIIVPSFGPVTQTLACLRSVARAETDVSFEVIVVDDDPGNPHTDLLESIDSLTLLRNAENSGFLHSSNRGAAAARGRYLVFLNNDALVMNGWLDRLRETFAAIPRVGIAGSRLLNPDGSLQEAGGIVWRDGSACNFGCGDDPEELAYSFARGVDYVSAASLMIDADLFRRLGGFDEIYSPAFYEDTDLAFRTRAEGYEVVYQPASQVVHIGGASYGRDLTRGLKRYQEKSRIAFQERFARELEACAEPDASARRESLRLAGRHVLVMDLSMPTPDKDSGSLRMVNLLRVLRRMGFQPTFLPANLSDIQPYVGNLQKLGIRVACPPYVHSIPLFLEEWGGLFDLCILSRPVVGAAWLELVRLLCPRATVLYDMVDLHYLRRERELRVLGASHVTEAEVANELRSCRRADGVVAVSEYDREQMAELDPSLDLHVISNIHEAHPSATPFAERTDLLFIGGFRHAPNCDAVLWFVEEVLPKIRRRLDDVVFRIVGSETPEEIRALASDHVVVEGYVEDVAPLFGRARVSVAPLRYGSGVKGKVNQSMAYGVPCVATTIAAEGMAAAHGSEILIADRADGFAEHVVDLYQDEARWQAISRGGTESLLRTFGMDVAEANLRAILEHYRCPDPRSRAPHLPKPLP